MRFAPLALAAACFLTLFLGLDTVGYLDAREARDALVAEELRSSREYLTPLFGHEPLFDKPIAGYLPELLTHDPVAESPVASRILRALIASLLVLLTGSIGAQQFGARAGVMSAMVLISTLAMPLAARGDAAQLMGTLAAWTAIGLFARGIFPRGAGPATGRAPGAAPAIAAHVSLAAAAMLAGPMPALWPLAGVALYTRLSRGPETLASVRPLAAIAVIAGIAIAWYGPMTERHGLPFLAHAAFFPYGASPPGPWYAGLLLTFSLLVAATFPWCALLPAALAHAAQRWRRAAGDEREEREERAAHFFIACLIASLVPVALYPSPPITAALPAAPAVALLCGRFLDHLIEDPARLRAVFVRASLMLGVTGTVVAIALSMAGTRLTALFPAIRWLAPFALISGWAPFLTHFFLRRTAVAAALIAAPIVIGIPLVSWRLLPELEDFLSARRAAEAMNVASPPLAPLALLEDAPATLRLYLARNPVRIDSLSSLPRLEASDGYAYLAYRPGREKETAVRLGSPLEVLLRSPTLVLARTPVR